MKKIVLVLAIFISYNCKGQNIEREAALEDFIEFIQLLEVHSSYFQVCDYNFENHFEEVKEKISHTDSVPIHFLAFQMEKIIAETNDRHASVKMEDFDEDAIELFNLHFPFAVAPLNGKTVGLIRNKSTKDYSFYAEEYPYVKSINNIPVIDFIERYAYRRKNSPTDAKLYDGVKDLRDIGELLFKQNELSQKEIDIVLTNGKTDKIITLSLSKKKNRWTNIGHTQDPALLKAMYFDEPFDYNKLDRWQEDSIAYFQFPAMFSYHEFAELELHIKTAINKYKDAKAVIIDIRGNGGGTRDILNTLAGYIVQPEQSPWIANVAYVRNDQQLDEDIESMDSRYLYSYYSQKLTDDDRIAIDTFNNNFKTELKFNHNKFSQPYYMVLKTNGIPLKCPIYVLVDEQSFSAASVFTSALKGLTNVKIVGVTTNGSSGRSNSFHLSNSNIRIKLSTMLSFQRNGKTLDGHGTIPDIIMERDALHILGKRDSQLNTLIMRIKENQAK